MIKVVLFLMGVASLSLASVWVLSLVLFVFGDSPYPGAVARLPGWVFAPSIFVPLFHRSRSVERFFEETEKILMK